MSVHSFTFLDLVTRNANLYGEKMAFSYEGRQVTHAQYARRGAQLAAGLAGLGVRVGDRLAVLAPTCMEYVDLFAAAAYLGAIVVPINVRLSSDEVAYVISDAAPRALFVSAESETLLPKALDDVSCFFVETKAQGAYPPMEQLYLDGAPPTPTATDDTAFAILYTAAVGGRPRGALLTHGGLMQASSQSQMLWGLTADDVHLGVLPLYHVAAMSMIFATQHAGGATLLLSRFDPDALVQRIDVNRGSLLGVFPPMLNALGEAATRAGSTLVHLRVLTGIDSPENVARFKHLCPGAIFWSGYGQTETSGPICQAPMADRPGSAGLSVGRNAVHIVDDLDRPVGVGVSGEIVVRGPTVFQGYWRRQEDNTISFRNGYLHTGDLGRIDADGYLWYIGRCPEKQLIKSGGENVYPAEVEQAILAHPAIASAAVLGVADAQWGEVVKAVCELKPGCTLTQDELLALVGTRIARYKRPKQVEFVASLPKTAAGALDRDAIRTLYGDVPGQDRAAS